MLRVAIVEDDALYGEQLDRFTKQYGEEHSIEISTTVFGDGTDIIDRYEPVWDIILMDIEMPKMNGLEAARQIRRMDESVLIIFITNMAQYAIQGYEVAALDYVLKPINYFAFSMKMRRACSLLNRKNKKSVLLQVEGETKRVAADTIRYIEVADHQLIYHTVDGDHQVFGTLKKLEDELGEGFVRCNQCYLVNLRFVEGVKGDCIVVGNDLLKISRPKKKAVLQKISGYYQSGGQQ